MSRQTNNNARREAVIADFHRRHTIMFKKVSRAININDDAAVQRCLEATFGEHNSLNCLLGSNAVERANMARRLGSRACELARDGNLELAILEITEASWSFDRHCSVLDLPLIRRVNNQLKRLKEASVSVVGIGTLPVARDGFEYCPIVRTAVLSKNVGLLSAEVVKLGRRFQRPAGLSGGSVQLTTLPRQSVRHCFTAVASLFDMRDPLRRTACELLDNAQVQNWEAGRTDRTIERYQTLSMCTLDRLVMATGDLAPTLDGLLREGSSRARKLYAAGDKPLHRDQIAHFWFERLLRRGGHVVPPFVKLR